MESRDELRRAQVRGHGPQFVQRRQQAAELAILELLQELPFPDDALKARGVIEQQRAKETLHGVGFCWSLQPPASSRFLVEHVRSLALEARVGFLQFLQDRALIEVQMPCQ